MHVLGMAVCYSSQLSIISPPSYYPPVEANAKTLVGLILAGVSEVSGSARVVFSLTRERTAARTGV